MKGDKWTLHRKTDGSRLADLVIYDWDFPWVNARVEAAEGLVDLRPLFTEEVACLKRADDDVDSWELAYEAVRGAVTLRDPEGTDIPEFLLHVDGARPGGAGTTSRSTTTRAIVGSRRGLGRPSRPRADGRQREGAPGRFAGPGSGCASGR